VIYYELFLRKKKRLWVIMAVLSIVLHARNITLELRPSLEHPGNFHYEGKCWFISQIHIDVCFAFEEPAPLDRGGDRAGRCLLPPNQARLQLNFSKIDQNLNLIPLPPPNVRKIAILAPPCL
jgi:hypothetical protein